jgi:hypothetical protein
MRRVDLRSWLAPLPRTRLEELTEEIGVPVGRDLVGALRAALATPEVVFALLKRLSPDAVRLLRSFCYASLHHITLSDETLIRTETFRELYRLGLVGVGKEFWGTLRIVLPDEPAEILLDRFQSENAACLDALEPQPVEKIRSKTDRFLRNVTTIIAMAEQGIPLTAREEITKSYLTRTLMPLLELDAIDGGKADANSPDLAHALGFAFFVGLIEKKERTLCPSAAADLFLDADDRALAEALLSYALEHANRLPIRRIIETFTRMRRPNWAPEPLLLERHRPEGLGKRDAKDLDQSWSAAVTILTTLGIFESGHLPDGVRALRLGELWREEDRTTVRVAEFTVTPDFRVSALRSLTPILRRELGRLADFVKSDMMDQWEITRSSVARAADQGSEAEGIIEFLSKHASNPLPENIAASIRQWHARHTEVRYHLGPILIVPDPEEERRIRELIGNDGAILARPLPGLLVLDPRKAESVLQKVRGRRPIGRVPAARRTKSGDFAALLERLAAGRDEKAGGAPAIQMVAL